MTNALLDPHALALLRFAGANQRHTEALARATGEHFNVFEVLRVGHYEVRTHSPILAELLNPKGTHGQGSIFLRHFCSALAIQGFDPESAWVRTEYHIGPQTEEEGGRIDILISDKRGGVIIIENKIYAGEQRNQLMRYRNYSAKAHLFFLTLGGESSIDAELPNAPKVNNISYSKDIVPWLEACRKEAVNAPTVRETITQYIHLIKRLTRQNTNQLMNNEIIKAVTDDGTGATYLAYASLRNADGEIRKAIIAKVNARWEALGRELGLETLELLSGQGVKEEQCYYTTPAMKAQNLKFGLRFSAAGYRGSVYGFAYMDRNSTGLSSPSILTRFKEVCSEQAKSNSFWHAYEYWSLHLDWSDATMAAIISGAFAADLEGLVCKMVQVANESTTASAVTPGN